MDIKRIIIITIISLFGGLQAFSQKPDSISNKADTVKQKSKQKAVKPVPKKETGPFKDSARLALEAMPRKAVFRSAILPGLGQFHNKGVWYLKVPAIYAGLISFGIATSNNQRDYKLFLREAQYRQEYQEASKDILPLKYAKLSDEAVIIYKDNFRRNRDLSILGLVGVYAVNLIDAYVTAKFFRYDIGEDLSFRLQPSIINQPVNANSSPIPAIKFTLSL